MPKVLTQYRVFIGSPGGLEEERNLFRRTLEKCTELYAEPRGVTFYPVGWEDTISGVGRPQQLINEDLRQCDYALFILHDRWGTATGDGYSSGTEEEWHLAEQLYEQTKIRNIALFFKRVASSQLRDPGEQLRKVLAFKQGIEEGKKYLFKSYGVADEFRELLEAQLAGWLTDHEGTASASSGGPVTIAPPTTMVPGSPAPSKPADPGFDYWITEAGRLTGTEPPNYSGALFCAERALAAARPGIEWVRAKYSIGVDHFYLNNPNESISAFTAIVEHFDTVGATDEQSWAALALLNKGVTLRQLGRSEDAVAAYDDIIARFGSATEPPLREQVAKALFNKGLALGQLGRSDEEVAVYDDVIARFRSAAEPLLREQVAKALFNKGVTFGQLGRSDEEVAVYDDVIARFGSAAELPLREQVAKALVNKGFRLGQVGRREDAVAVYDDVIARFGSAPEAPLRERVAKALVNKGVTLGQLGRSEDAVAVYDDTIARFGSASEMPLREQVAMALVNKGVALGQLGRSEDAVVVYDDVIARFGSALEAPLRERVARALVNKGITLDQLGRREDAMAVYDDVIARFGSAPEAPLREQVARALDNKEKQKTRLREEVKDLTRNK